MKYITTTIFIFFIISCNSNNVKVELSKLDNSQHAIIKFDSLRFFHGFVLDTAKINFKTKKYNLRPYSFDSLLIKNDEGIVFKIYKDNSEEESVAHLIIGTIQDSLMNLYYNEYGGPPWHWKLNKVEYYKYDSTYIEINTIIEPIEFALSYYIDFCCNENGTYEGIKEKMRLKITNYN